MAQAVLDLYCGSHIMASSDSWTAVNATPNATPTHGTPTHGTPASALVDEALEPTIEIPFFGESVLTTLPPKSRMVSFVRKYTFVYVHDRQLRTDISRISLFDAQTWEYVPGSHVYRLADMVCLIYRLCEDKQLWRTHYADDYQSLFGLLSDELDRFCHPRLQVDFNLARDASGPTEWLQYFYWCNIIEHLQVLKGLVVRVDSNGRINPHGEPKAARFFGARQLNGGFVLCCGWNWGMDTVVVGDIQHLNSYGVFFSDRRMQDSILLNGWSSQRVPTSGDAYVRDVFWEAR